MKEIDIELVQLWITKAENDYRAAQYLLKENEPNIPYDVICFHCQQSVEKYLKAFLVYLDKDFPLTHNIGSLVKQVLPFEPEISTLIERAETLTPFAVDIRYPDDFIMPTREDSLEAFGIAGDVKNFILERLRSIY